jgi:hypothetical protein
MATAWLRVPNRSDRLRWSKRSNTAWLARFGVCIRGRAFVDRGPRSPRDRLGALAGELVLRATHTARCWLVLCLGAARSRCTDKVLASESSCDQAPAGRGNVVRRLVSRS